MVETIEAIRREVVVGTGQARAFEIFTADMTPGAWTATLHAYVTVAGSA